MKVLLVLCFLVMITVASPPVNIDYVDGEPLPRQPGAPLSDRIPIDAIGDIRAILGSQGKSIAASQNGEAIAVIYGGHSADPNNPMVTKVAYSTDSGMTWNIYGPFGNPPCRRLYNSVVGTPNFHANEGELFFIWQESTLDYNDGVLKVMIERNVPSSPSFSVPTVLPNSSPPAMYPWLPDIDWDKDNPQNLVATGWSFVANGNEWAYCWISNDGGYTWTDTIPMAFISMDGACGNLSYGNGGYVVYAYHDYRHLGGNDSIPAPYYMESTDGGYTWSAETVLDIVPANMGSQFWWHEMDCLVINNEPWFVHTDIGSPGGGPYVVKGTGSPGNWTWNIWDAGVIGACSGWVFIGFCHARPSQYPSLSYDPSWGTILASYKAYYYVGDSITSLLDGAHIGGIYTTNNGATWHIAAPLSEWNNGQIAWADWHATETAHHLVHDGSNTYASSIWMDQIGLHLYFERGFIYGFPWTSSVKEEKHKSKSYTFMKVMPNLVSNHCAVTFTLTTAVYATLALYNASGRLVQEIYLGLLNKSTHKMDFNTSNLANGTYFLVLETEYGQQVEKIIVAR